jgi:hypothetical protein
MRASHRHPARASATLLPKESSLYDAIRSIIGVELRSKLDAPKSLPSYLDDLLKELDDRLGSDQVQGSTHSEPPTNRWRGSRFHREHVLALFGTRRLTEDGLEYTFALNHMSYFVVTEGLWDRL